MIDDLLNLQAIDTTADQLTHRRSHLPERESAQSARASYERWKRLGDDLARRIDELSAEIDATERDSGDIDRHRERLNAQLRTVIAPREAEALQHEIKTLSDRRSELDDRGLLALEQQAAVDDDRASHAQLESTVSAEVEAAERALADAETEIDQLLTELDDRRAELRARLPAPLLARYDRLRAQLGVAVARLVGTRCEGCHLDLSAAEVEAVKALGPEELADCPQCGRLLVH